MNTLTPNIKHISNPAGFITLIKYNIFDKESMVRQRLLYWEQIDFLDRWKADRAVPPTSIINRTIDQIIKTQDRDIYFNFRKK